jgi:CRP-like cAMP-binding protein
MNALYAGLSAGVRQELAEHELFVTVPAGTRLAECGEPAEQLIIFNSGRAKTDVLVGGRRTSMGIAGPGSVFGLSSMLTEAPLVRGLTCLEQCEVTILPKRAFLEVLKRNPQMYFAVVRVLSADLAGLDRIIRNHVRVSNGKASSSMGKAHLTERGPSGLVSGGQ